jgi:outer membrane receptor protein involved in Fe transport
MPDVSSIPGVLLKSNPDLRTEYLTAWDAGFEKDWGTSWTLGGDMFVNRLRDLIAMARAGGSMSYVNVDRAWSRGFNESLTWRVGKAFRCS